MNASIPGLHHVTAVAGGAQRNLDFYAGVLGLRLVKRTVNFDDPGTYHLYYGDAAGRPGTILTFFPWAHAAQGHAGPGMTAATAFAVPPGALGDYWTQRLTEQNVPFDPPAERFGAPVLSLRDPDGLPLELVEDETAAGRPAWAEGPVPEAYAARGFHGVTLGVRTSEATRRLLTEAFGYEVEGEAGDRTRLRATSSDGRACTLDLLRLADPSRGRPGRGTVHHVAFRVPDAEAQAAWRERLLARGLQVTPVKDRQYFQSIYFREPGGVLFEIATDPPGFTLDEPEDRLGAALKLPDWLEPRRASIESQLPPLTLP